MKITFIAADGSETRVDAAEGDSVMQAAVQNDVDGIIGECGGSMMCATCHCYVDDGWTEAVGGQQDGESDLLDCAASEVRASSRLSCQIRMRAELDGVVIHLPESQL
ncbi:2Fe-2S iron-sulfur cluster-binding protein (plasmid) [Paracoccus sp. MA]|uniref:2Fe-2S iron-sulfur cluster-binding protein n=1 Tax=Paracoccus sp. MA TaxID=2895796 RepID=UPI001E5DE1DC|nr:2Fe-2S iron-sulfur cluster-binding protein [Paracoccus sp. MA]UFM67213.1 2Fe-2S iron-sulfur cluster-binding protein [Paracoccus sp. MA]